MTFEEYLYKSGKNDEEFEAIIDNSEMPATFCPSDETIYSDYCHEKYGELLKSKVTVIKDSTETTTAVIEVDYDNYDKARDFCMAMAGYVGISEDAKLFPKRSENISYDKETMTSIGDDYLREKRIIRKKSGNINEELLDLINVKKGSSR